MFTWSYSVTLILKYCLSQNSCLSLTVLDTQVQQLTLECLLTWQHDYLVPYRETLERFIREDSFREELALFSPDTVQAAHRSQFIEVLSRVLYGKMTLRRGRQGGGKVSQCVTIGLL